MFERFLRMTLFKEAHKVVSKQNSNEYFIQKTV